MMIFSILDRFSVSEIRISYDIASQEEWFSIEPINIEICKDDYSISFFYKEQNGIAKKTMYVSVNKEIIYVHSPEKSKISYSILRDSLNNETINYVKIETNLNKIHIR